MSEFIPRPRPLLSANVESLASDAICDATQRLDLAYATAAKVVSAGRSTDTTSDMVALADLVGLETLAQLWQHAPPDSLPGALWSLYVLRAWCADHGEEVARLYRAGRGLAPVDEVVAGAHDDADPLAMMGLAEAVLSGVYRGDLAVALERAASFFRVVAEGRLSSLESQEENLPANDSERQRAARNLACANALCRAADAWRAGTLVKE